MHVDVITIVRQLLPDLLRHHRPSVAWVRTTHEKYLVFDEDPSRPACVVEIGDAARLRRIDNIMSTLHARGPGVVPRPLACAEWARDTVVQIQEGVAGVPWFRLAEFVPTHQAWLTLLNRSVAAMRGMHSAIATVPAWRGTVNIADELSLQIERCRSGAASIEARRLAQVEVYARRVRGCTMPAIAQHGDFSVNNLIIAPESVTVIDFEEFGLTRMPLHDAFGLALSFDWSQDGRCPLSLAECFERCLASAPPDEEVVTALLLHHLLWRINQCDGHPTRAGLRARLAGLVEEVCESAPTRGSVLSAAWRRPIAPHAAAAQLPIPSAG